MQISTWALATPLALVALTFAQTLPEGVTRVASVEGITEYRLDNGFRALLFPDPSKPTITVNMTYLVGSRHENYGETGMAHIIEHLVSYGARG
jgi:zinc protease